MLINSIIPLFIPLSDQESLMLSENKTQSLLQFIPKASTR